MLKNIFLTITSLSRKERGAILILLFVLTTSLFVRGIIAFQEKTELVPTKGGVLVEGVLGQPIAINPIISNNPVDQDISKLIYSNLGDLAEEITIDEDEQTYTIRIFEELKWSDDYDLTTEDIIFTIDLIQNPETNSPLARNWQGVRVERISGLRLSLTIPAPFVFFEDYINRLPIIPKHIFGNIPAANLRLSSFNLEPISSGPYKIRDFEQRRDGFINSYNLTRNESYHREEPFIDEIRFRFFEDQESIIEALKSRRIDALGSTQIIDIDINNERRIKETVIPMSRYYAAFFNPRAESYLNNEEIRSLLSSSIDRNFLVKNILNGKANAIDRPMRQEDINNLSLSSTNKNEIRERLLEVVGEEEFSINILVPDIDVVKRTAEFLKKEWEAVGVDEVIITPVSTDEFLSSVLIERNYEVLLFGHILENDMDLFPFWHSSERFYPGFNLSMYSNSIIDEQLEILRQTKDEDERYEIFTTISERLKDDAPASFLYSIPYTYIHKDGINIDIEKSVVTPSDRFNSIESWYIKQKRSFN